MFSLIFAICWLIIGSMILYSYWDFIMEVEELPQRIIACVIFQIGGPLYILTNLMIDILDMILPEGWDDDDGYS